ncbi:MAG: alpha/beta hydrolase family protein [Calditrichaceae bacterium]
MKKKLFVTILLIIAVIILALFIIDSGIIFIRKEHVRISSNGVILDAVLATPRLQRGPFPAAVVIPGSAPVTKEDLDGYIRIFVPRGLAILLYDKRGVGKSTGKYKPIEIHDSEILLGDLADDASSAISFLSSHPDIDSAKTGLIGVSQAGWIMPLAASRNSGVKYIASISGPAVTYGQEMYYSQLTGDDPGYYKNLSEQEIERLYNEYQGPHGYDPEQALKALAVPSIWIVGEADRSVPTFDSVAKLRSLDKKHPGIFTIKVFPNCDHNLYNKHSNTTVGTFSIIFEWLKRRKLI